MILATLIIRAHSKKKNNVCLCRHLVRLLRYRFLQNKVRCSVAVKIDDVRAFLFLEIDYINNMSLPSTHSKAKKACV